jgi:hypothetical protein
MISSIRIVGSTLWRIRHYGIIPALKYNLQKVNLNKSYEASLQNLHSGMLKFGFNTETHPDKHEFIEQALNITRDRFDKVDNSFKLDSKLQEFLMDRSDNTRLFVMGILILESKPPHVVETGTQLGISANFFADLFDISFITSKLTTLDVKKCPENISLVWNNRVYQKVLEAPARESFIKELEKVAKSEGNIFFHDSDHSSENMKFEYYQVLSSRKFSWIVSDDVDLNDEFSKFCVKNNLLFSIIGERGGQNIGIAKLN